MSMNARFLSYFDTTWDIMFTVMILSFRTDRFRQTVLTQIRLLLLEQSDQGLHCLLFHLYFLEAFLWCKPNLLKFKGDYSNILFVRKFRTFTVISILGIKAA